MLINRCFKFKGHRHRGVFTDIFVITYDNSLLAEMSKSISFIDGLLFIYMRHSLRRNASAKLAIMY